MTTLSESISGALMGETDVLFCPICGTFLDLPSTLSMTCPYCKYKCSYQDLDLKAIHTRSRPKPIPKWLKAHITDEKEDIGNDKAIVDEECPQCHHPQLTFYTMQLRSADEGSTVFYECPKCAYKFNVNN